MNTGALGTEDQDKIPADSKLSEKSHFGWQPWIPMRITQANRVWLMLSFYSYVHKGILCLDLCRSCQEFLCGAQIQTTEQHGEEGGIWAGSFGTAWWGTAGSWFNPIWRSIWTCQQTLGVVNREAARQFLHLHRYSAEKTRQRCLHLKIFIINETGTDLIEAYTLPAPILTLHIPAAPMRWSW